jgi:nitroreductase
MHPLHPILDLARWAPSGDNTQPWRFEIRSTTELVVHVFETRDLYDLEGWASQIAVGAMLESMRIAASEQGLRAEVSRQQEVGHGRLRFTVKFAAQPGLKPDPLVSFVKLRTVHRRPLRLRPLDATLKQALEASLGTDFTVVWLEGWQARVRMARLLSANARLRYSIPEGFAVHRRVIAPNAQFSEDRMPDQAVGLDPVSRHLMAWALVDWRRVQFLNRYLGGSLLPTLELDFMPAVFCAAHALIVARQRPRNVDDVIHAGRAVQRFWLTATSVGLMMQPETTPLIFSAYAKHSVRFSSMEGSMAAAARLGMRLRLMFREENAENAVFMCRVGYGRAPRARALRLPVDALIIRSAEPSSSSASSVETT